MPANITVVKQADLWLTILALTIILTPLVAAVSSFVFRRRVRMYSWMTPTFSAVSLFAAFAAAQRIGDNAWIIPLKLFNFYLDALSIYFVLLVNLVALFASFATSSFMAFDEAHNPSHSKWKFHFFFNLFHMTMLLVPMVDNLVLLWIAVELTTVCSTMLVRYRHDRASLEAAWKFIMITTTGIIFALLGTLFLANAIQQSKVQFISGLPQDLMRWSALANPAVARSLNQNYVILSFLFILLGYGTKAGLAPMHTWLPDGHGQAPAPVSALLSGVMLKSALYAILRFYTVTNLCLGDSKLTSRSLLAVGLLSLVLATPFILKRNRFKRVLAYHSLEHMGIITFGIGIGVPVALFGALLHTLNHALTKALMFLVYGLIQYEYQDRCGTDYKEGDDEHNIHGVLRVMPLSATILAFGGLALVGSPPFNIFMSEFIILWAAIKESSRQPFYYAAVILFVLTVTLIFGGLVGHLSRLLLGSAPFQPVETDVRRLLKLAPFFALVIIIFLFGLVVPNWPINLPAILQRSVLILNNGVSLPVDLGMR